MTPADHAALSAQLARALGFPSESVRVPTWHPTKCEVFGARDSMGVAIMHWHEFDYRSAWTALPILTWLVSKHRACLQEASTGEPFCIWVRFANGAHRRVTADTLHEAIARAAIAVADAKRQQVEQNEAREVLQP